MLIWVFAYRDGEPVLRVPYYDAGAARAAAGRLWDDPRYDSVRLVRSEVTGRTVTHHWPLGCRAAGAA